MPRVLSIVLYFLQLTILSGAMIGWALAFARRSRGRPLYPYQPRHPVPWGLLDLGMIAFASLSATVIAVASVGSLLGVRVGAALSEMAPRQVAVMMLTDSVVSLAVLVTALAWVRWRVRASVRDFGIDPNRIDADVGLGMVAFVMLVVPVFLIQFLLMTVFPDQQQHPLVTMLKANADPQLVLVAAFVAVIVAPIVEEYFFRVFLQGWLENVACRYGEMHELLLGGSAGDDAQWMQGGASAASHEAVEARDDEPRSHLDSSLPTPHHDDLVIEAELTAETDVNPYDPPADLADAAPAGYRPGSGPLRPRHWPVFVSAIVFAGMHLGQGYSPIPLFFLAVGLGYLYQQTHRILPCIVVHLLLNATSLVGLWVSVKYGGSASL